MNRRIDAEESLLELSHRVECWRVIIRKRKGLKKKDNFLQCFDPIPRTTVTTDNSRAQRVNRSTRRIDAAVCLIEEEGEELFHSIVASHRNVRILRFPSLAL